MRAGYGDGGSWGKELPQEERKALHHNLLKWCDSPTTFFAECLDVDPDHIWSGMEQICKAVVKYPKVAVGAGHGVSKAMPLTTPILTRRGLIEMADVRVGDKVLAENGRWVKVTGLSPITDKPCYELRFSDSTTLTADADHLWRVHDFLTRKRLRRAGAIDYRSHWADAHNVTTAWIADHLLHNGQGNLSIPTIAPVHGRKTLEFPYTVGFWLGDGTTCQGSVTVHPVDALHIIPRIEDEGFICKKHTSNVFGWQVSGKRKVLGSLAHKLRKLNLLNNKHFPTWFCSLRFADKLAVLQGYMDADGWRLKHGGTAKVGTTDERMHTTFLTFLASFGVKANATTEQIIYNDLPKTVYKVCFTPSFQPFSLPRKQLSRRAKQAIRRTARMITGCEPVGVRAVRCLVVDSPVHLFAAGRHLIPTHNSFTAARLALWFLYNFWPSTVITTAPTYKQVQEILWREIRSAHANAKVKLGGKPTQVKLDMQDETGIKWYALGFSTKPDTVTLEATAFQGYHNDHMMVIFDEAAAVMPQIYKAANHLLTAGHCRWLAIGNPTAPRGSFADALQGKDGWHAETIAVCDTPNYIKGIEADEPGGIPGVSGRLYEQTIKAKYGEDSNEYRIRILGQLPEWQEGTIFGRELAAAQEDGRVGHFPPDPAGLVYTFWDVGHTNTAIWFAQFIRREIRLIDFYYDSEGKGLPAYAKMLQDKPYRYGEHFAPHDVQGSNAKSIQTGKYLMDVAAELGISWHVLADYGYLDGVSAAKDLVRLCLFNESACAEGITALSQYRHQLDATQSTDDKPVYKDGPVKDWTCHVADAFRYLAMAYRYDLIIKHERIGYPGAVINEDAVIADEAARAKGGGVYDPLGGRVRRRIA